jgi:hypothetical protein
VVEGDARTLQEIADATGDPHASISAQLRHLRKPRFGAYAIDKRRRTPSGGTWSTGYVRTMPREMVCDD